MSVCSTVRLNDELAEIESKIELFGFVYPNNVSSFYTLGNKGCKEQLMI